ncbi:MAG: hypothetical protein HUK08_02640 [Bacteroidaceae bacterium]|nr:hypothetical protein [Bacteroidaceae bacterium]
MKKGIIIVCCMMMTTFAFAQSEGSVTGLHTADSIPRVDLNVNRIKSSTLHTNYELHTLPTSATRYGDYNSLPMAAKLPTDIISQPTIIQPGVIGKWLGGVLHGNVYGESLPGLMAIENGQIGINQRIGSLSFSVYGQAVKYGFYHGMSRQWGVGGSVAYRISPRLSVTLFGSYYTTPQMAGSMMSMSTPAMAGYMQTTTFGGYFDYSFNDYWGVEVGAKTYQSVMTRRFEVQPIVMPYYKLGRKVKLGVDVGGILYQILRAVNTDNRPSNPTIMPPQLPKPFVR